MIRSHDSLSPRDWPSSWRDRASHTAQPSVPYLRHCMPCDICRKFRDVKPDNLKACPMRPDRSILNALWFPNSGSAISSSLWEGDCHLETKVVFPPKNPARTSSNPGGDMSHVGLSGIDPSLGAKSKRVKLPQITGPAHYLSLSEYTDTCALARTTLRIEFFLLWGIVGFLTFTVVLPTSNAAYTWRGSEGTVRSGLLWTLGSEIGPLFRGVTAPCKHDFLRDS